MHKTSQKDRIESLYSDVGNAEHAVRRITDEIVVSQAELREAKHRVSQAKADLACAKDGLVVW